MKRLLYMVAAAAVATVVAGCSATAPVDVSDDASASAAKGADRSGRREMADEMAQGEGGDADSGSLLSRTTIYFELDSSEIQPEFREVLRAHGNHLVAHPDIRVTIEGHTDERGSREYNLALGERRALAVRQLLILQGVGAEQLEVISFGEERPADPGHDEAAWRKNRRAYLRYMGH